MKVYRIIDVSAATGESEAAITAWARRKGISVKKQGGLTIDQIIEFDNRSVNMQRNKKQDPDMHEVRMIMKALAIANGDLEEDLQE